jgi:hypothetical protein
LLQHITELELCYQDFIASWQSHVESKSNDVFKEIKSA